jgi:hypothetical protein
MKFVFISCFDRTIISDFKLVDERHSEDEAWRLFLQICRCLQSYVDLYHSSSTYQADIGIIPFPHPQIYSADVR